MNNDSYKGIIIGWLSLLGETLTISTSALNHEFLLAKVRVRGTLAATFYTRYVNINVCYSTFTFQKSL